MGDLGLQGAYGNDALFNLLHQRRMEQAASQMYSDKMRQQQFENQRQLTGDQRAQQQLDATLENTRLIRERQNTEDTIKQGNTMNEAIPGGTTMPMNDPRLGALRSAGAQLTHQDATLPSTQYAQSLIPGQTAPKSGGFLVTTNAGNPEQYIKEPTEKQAGATAERDRKTEATQAAIDAKVEGLRQAAEHLRMQGEVNAANILRAKAEAEAATARANATNAKGNTINLSQAGKSARSAIETAGPLTDQVIQMILKEAPDIETNPQKYNTSMNKLQSLYQTGKYKAGFYDKTDPRQQLVSLLQPIQAGQYTRSSRSRQMLDLALKHMADPTQTLLTQYQRAKELKGIMPEMLQGIVRAEQPVDPSNPLGGSYFDPSHAAAGGGGEYDYVPGKGLVPRQQ